LKVSRNPPANKFFTLVIPGRNGAPIPIDDETFNQVLTKRAPRAVTP
jgi:hypothetical protein